MGVIGGTGAVEWASDTVEQTNYFCCSAGAPILDEGLFFAGEQFGSMAVAHTSIDGTVDWAYNYYNGGSTTIDAVGLPGTGIVVLGELPYMPTQQWYATLLAVRSDGFLLSYTKLRTDPCRPRSLDTYSAFNMLFLSASTSVPDITNLYLIDAWGDLSRGFSISGVGGIAHGGAKLTRIRPPVPGEMEPPPHPPESLIFVGSGRTMDVSLAATELEPGAWYPFPENPLPLTLNAAVLPVENLTITPEEVSYTLDSPAGETDALFMRIENVF
jgi:hypothetical protein